jgi:hypothetical protein
VCVSKILLAEYLLVRNGLAAPETFDGLEVAPLVLVRIGLVVWRRAEERPEDGAGRKGEEVEIREGCIDLRVRESLNGAVKLLTCGHAADLL